MNFAGLLPYTFSLSSCYIRRVACNDYTFNVGIAPWTDEATGVAIPVPDQANLEDIDEGLDYACGLMLAALEERGHDPDVEHLLASRPDRVMRWAEFISPYLFEGADPFDFDENRDEDDPELKARELVAELLTIAEHMVRPRLLVVTLLGDPEAALKCHPKGWANWHYEVEYDGLLPWLGRDFFAALSVWLGQEEDLARESLVELLAHLRKDAAHRTTAGILAVILTAYGSSELIGPSAARVCRECRPPPPVLLTAGGRDRTHIPLN